MLDLGFLTLPFVGAAAVFGLALFTGEEISISKIAVPTHLEEKGLSDVVVTRHLTDEIRELNVVAASELASVDVDGGSLDKSVSELESYFQLEQLFTGVRDLFGLVPFYVSGELTGDPAELTMTLRVFYKEENRPSDVISVNGNIEGLHEIIHEAALGALEHINPYVVAIYWRRIEAAQRDFAFPRAKKAIDRYLQERPVEEHYLAYGLLGRMAMHKAEQTEISSEERQAAYADAQRYLEAAVLQKPDFENANVNLGILHAVLGDYGRSDGYFVAAVEADPNDRVARRLAGPALRLQRVAMGGGRRDRSRRSGAAAGTGGCLPGPRDARRGSNPDRPGDLPRSDPFPGIPASSCDDGYEGIPQWPTPPACAGQVRRGCTQSAGNARMMENRDGQ
jgi:tetratricopeptide (TPR) repeat protein